MNHIIPPFPLNPRRALVCALLLSSPFAIAETAIPAKTDTVKQMPEMTVIDKSAPAAATNKEKYQLPATTESVTAKQIDSTINAMNAEDTIKYLPSITVRKRYIGDTNAPVAWRTSGTGLSARGLIYADGIQLASLLGNNNGNTGSPRWNMVSPNEIERVDVMYGPFSAMYSGNSIGGVVEMTTKMPEKFEAGVDIKTTWQTYSIYGKDKTYDSQEYAFNLGDKVKDFSWRMDISHLDSHSQPIVYVNPISAGRATAADTPVIGAVSNLNPFGVKAQVLGESALNHTVQDNFKWKVGYDITPTIKASYTLGLWLNDNKAGFNSFLRNARTGAVVDSGNVNIGGQRYAANFAETRAEQMHWSHGMNIKSNTGGIFDWDLSGSVVEYGNDMSRTSTQTPARAAGNGAGRLTSLEGTGWQTADAKGIWRPSALGQHEVSFGFHHDLNNLDNPVYTVANNWAYANTGVLDQNSQGKTQTEAYWAQDAWDFHKDWKLTLGGRLENWHAFDGYNATTIGAVRNATTGVLTNTGRLVEINQADRNDLHFSPKFKLGWKPMERVQIGASIAQAYRFPTVTELFQTTTTTTGAVTTITNGNPNLKPEDALSSELATEYFLDKGKLRLSLFQERVNNAIYSQPGFTPTGAIISSPQNVGQTQTYGIEFSGDASDVGIDGLDLSGNATWADSRITENSSSDLGAAALSNAANLAALRSGVLPANPYAGAPSVGARQPRVPEWRASATVAYRPTDKWTNSVSMRYSSKQFSQLNNTDTNGGTYQGNTAFFVVDLRTKYQLTKQFAVAAGIDNVNNAEYWIFHPFPMRTYFAELKFNY
ncbi:MAG: TonB-dependent receptor [Methylococcales bacterium]|nr:TonB-dependent receptor [Methylococcales bacterium]MDP3838654.1 TonB-dependent receptor [Methylococcales bacterium]